MVLNKFKPPHVAMLRGALLMLCAGGGLSACASVAPMPEGLASPVAPQASRGQAPATLRYGFAQAPAQSGPRYKIGAPYQAGGVWYVPAEQPAYDEVGIASWYGDDFNGKPTANGELFDMNGVSAAHATLPMPSIVEVTNLENGRTLQVRLNDRGPFHPGRIIDLSRGAAQQLGFFNKGTAQVRVRFIKAAPLSGLDAPAVVASNRMQAILPLTPAAAASDDQATAATIPPSTARFTIQAGAFSDRFNADRAAARLGAAGRTAVMPVDRNGARLYRVTVGSFPKAEDASAARNRVSALGFAEARVVAGS